jgi:hypothetical protein
VNCVATLQPVCVACTCDEKVLVKQFLPASLHIIHGKHDVQQRRIEQSKGLFTSRFMSCRGLLLQMSLKVVHFRCECLDGLIL